MSDSESISSTLVIIVLVSILILVVVGLVTFFSGGSTEQNLDFLKSLSNLIGGSV